MSTTTSCVVNGLRITLICEPEATRAAALFQLSAGSFNEPARWPGLAHLLEHVLFAGSVAFQDQERLMAWAPANNARLNATTLAHSTAWFVETVPEQLNEALRRLTDMLARPLLAAEAIAAEAAAIDAEYRMLQSHGPTLCEAALSQAFAAPHPLHDFHVGSQRHFGQDAVALQQALLAYHQRFFHSGNLQLWLSGPQPLSALRELAETAAQAFAPVALPAVSPAAADSRFLSAASVSADLSSSSAASSQADSLSAPDASSPADSLSAPNASSQADSLSAPDTSAPADSVSAPDTSSHADSLSAPNASVAANSLPASAALAPLRLAETRAFALQSSYSEHFQLSFIVSRSDPAAFSLLQELLLDKAQGSLLATLRAAGLCDDIALLEPYRSSQQSVLSVQFQLSGLQPQQCAEIEALFCHWLMLLPDLTSSQLAHYSKLAQRRFGQLSSLDRLRALAFGLPPASETCWHLLLTQLHQQNMSRLWVSPAVSAPETTAQGFSLRCGPFRLPDARPETPAIAFYSPAQATVLPALPATRSALRVVPASGEPSLLLSLLPGQLLCRRTAAIIEAALQPAMGECLHRGGELTFTRQHGLWRLHLSGKSELLTGGLHRALLAFQDKSDATQAYGERLYRKAQQTYSSDIAVRCLLAYLPDLLSAPQYGNDEAPTAVQDLSALRWQATFYGDEGETAETLARLLSQLPGKIVPGFPPVTVLPSRLRFFCPTESSDAAAIVFCPLSVASAECFTAWQRLAALLAPLFFQRLRVEQNIGYVVSCRFHQTAGQAGLLFALQSPSLSVSELFHHIEQFIADMAETVSGLKPDDRLFAAARALPALPLKNAEQINEHWLHQQLSLEPSDDAFTLPHLRQAYQQLIDDRARWWCVGNG